MGRWDQTIDSECIALLNQYRKDGGVLKVNEIMAAKLREVRAKEELDKMSPEERGQLLEKNAKKVDIFRKLPIEGRKRYLEKLSDEETLELVKSEILMVTIMQHQYQQSVEDKARTSTESSHGVKVFFLLLTVPFEVMDLDIES